jgi:integrase
VKTKVPTAFTEKTALAAKPATKPYEIRDRGGRNSVHGLLLRVQPSGRKIWYCQFARGKRERIGDSSVMTLARARKRAKIIMGKVEEGHDYQAERARKRNMDAQTLGGFIEAGYAAYAEEHIANPRDTLARLKRSFSTLYDKPMVNISEIDIERWRKRRKGVKFETLQRDFTCLKSCISVAYREFKLIDVNPLLGTTLRRRKSDPESTQNTPRFLTEDEEKSLRSALDKREVALRQARLRANAWREERGYKTLPVFRHDEFVDHIKPLVLLALNTGLRRGDLFGLEWHHVDVGLRQIRKIIEKTSHKRANPTPAIIPLSAEAVAVFRQWRKQNFGDDLVFPSPVTGTRLDNIKKAWKQVIEDSEIQDFRFHDLRHTFASRLVMGGVDLNTVRELMCHSDITMTLVYAHLSPDHRAAAVDLVFGGET